MHIHSKLLIRSLALVLVLAVTHGSVPALAIDTVTICGETVPLDTRELYLRNKDSGNLSPLADLKELSVLILEDVPADDLSPLTGLPLTNLALRSTRVSDLILITIKECINQVLPMSDRLNTLLVQHQGLYRVAKLIDNQRKGLEH